MLEIELERWHEKKLERESIKEIFIYFDFLIELKRKNRAGAFSKDERTNISESE